MVLRDRSLALASSLALVFFATSPLATAGDSAFTGTTAAPLNIPHTLQLELDFKARHRARGGAQDAPDQSSRLRPFSWPRNNDVRARLVTPELGRTPLFGWIAKNLYRSRKENGWCLEVDPGEGEYVVFYRVHL
jgi:hypothetical protein